jgi:hypothetical protein
LLAVQWSQLLDAIKGWLEGQSLNFFPVPHVMAVIILSRSGQNYPKCGFNISGRFLESWSLGFMLP